MARKDGIDRGLFQRDGNWWIRYADEAGKERRELAGSKSAARQLYNKRKEEARLGRKLPPPNRKPVTVAGLLDHYLPEMLSGKKPKGVKAYQKQAEIWRKKLGDEVAASLEPGKVERIKSQLEGSLAPATVNRRLTFLRRLFSLAVRDGKVASNPLGQGRVRQLREKNCKERFFSQEEEQAMKATARPALWSWILLGLNTGLRRGEQFALKREHVDLKARSIWLEDTKAGEPQRLRLNSVAVEVLTGLLGSHDSEWVFPGRSGGHIHLDAVTRRFARLCKALNLKGATWHTLRHTFISRLAMLGTPLPSLQKLARHKTIQVTLRYSHLCPRQEEENLEELAKKFSLPESTGTKISTGKIHVTKDPVSPRSSGDRAAAS